MGIQANSNKKPQRSMRYALWAMPPPENTEVGALEEARKRLYAPEHMPEASRAPLLRPTRTLVHLWRDNRPPEITHFERRHVRLAGGLLFWGGERALRRMVRAQSDTA